jgi:hypothetical protein
MFRPYPRKGKAFHTSGCQDSTLDMEVIAILIVKNANKV